MDIIDFETLKFKQRDDMEDIINTWKLAIPFDIESLRDQRLRAFFKTRYDSRNNIIDWDYQFNIRKFTKRMDRQMYIKFRMTGVAFETRLADATVPNRTMGSYIEGKKRKSGDSCLVRGFWGDIINSPYIPMGIEVENEEDSKKFDKEYNFKRPYTSADIVEYHVEGYMTKLETLQDYVAPFEIIKQIEASKGKNKTEDSKVEEIKEEDEEKEEDKEEQKQEVKKESAKTDEVERDEDKDRTLLEGFKRLNVKFHLITGNISNLYQKQKYKNLFNIVALSMRCSDRIKKEFNQLLADNCYITIENGNKLVIFDVKNRKDFIRKLKEQTKEANWKELEDMYDHHCSFQYISEDAEIPEYRVIEDSESDAGETTASETNSQTQELPEEENKE